MRPLYSAVYLWWRHSTGLLLVLTALNTYATETVVPSRAIVPTGGVPQQLLALIREPPLGLPAVPVPATNLPTEARIALGRKLFFDRRLSFNGTLSCAMCHIPEQGFTQYELKTPVGIEGRFVKRNAPSLYNVAYRRHLFHDGRESSLENQVWQPLLRNNEMANPSISFVLDTLVQASDYDGMFEAAFQRGPTMETLGMALASYQRGLLSANSAFDRWYFGGEPNAMSAAAQRGFELFQRQGCVACHRLSAQYALFSDGEFHDTGIGYARAMLADPEQGQAVRLAPGVSVVPTVSFARPNNSDVGRYEATGRPEDRWLYLTPSLRNVAITAPYMHDGSMSDLPTVLNYYNAGAVSHPGLDPRLRPMGLDAGQLTDLQRFLEALTGNNIDTLRADGRAAAIGDRLEAR